MVKIAVFGLWLIAASGFVAGQNGARCQFVDGDVGVERACLSGQNANSLSKALAKQEAKPKYFCPSSYAPSVSNRALWVEREGGLYCISAPKVECSGDSIGNCFATADRDVEQCIREHTYQPSRFRNDSACAPVCPSGQVGSDSGKCVSLR